MENTDVNLNSETTEEVDEEIIDEVTDSLVFSATYTNYINYIKSDKENRTQGMWEIQAGNFNKLKYAYVYLKGSDKMIVKKYHIEKFEYAKQEKDYNKSHKVCFVFTKSEDIFFEYPYETVVQGRQYRDSKTMDKVPKLSENEIEIRLKKSENTPDNEPSNETKKRLGKKIGKKRGYISTPRDKLTSVYNEKFKDKKFTNLLALPRLEKQVEQGQDPETVLSNYFNSLEEK
jgi:hypothetical protein